MLVVKIFTRLEHPYVIQETTLGIWEERVSAET